MENNFFIIAAYAIAVLAILETLIHFRISKNKDKTISSLRQQIDDKRQVIIDNISFYNKQKQVYQGQIRSLEHKLNIQRVEFEELKSEFEEYKNMHLKAINKSTALTAYYKRRFIALNLTIKENFGNNKAVIRLLKNDFSEFRKKKIHELQKMNEKK